MASHLCSPAFRFGFLSAVIVLGLIMGFALPMGERVWKETNQYGADGAAMAMGGNQPPTAEAGAAQTVAVGATVQLDGTGSTEPEGADIDFAWQFVSVPPGSAASLSDATAPRPTFTADLAGDYVVQLIATEGPRSSAPDTVTISTTNSAPVANAGADQAVAVTDVVTLDASASSDFDGDPLTYNWTLVSAPAGSAAALSSTTAVRPTFTADVAGDYVLELVVNDGTVSSQVDQVTVGTGNVAPVAHAGPDQRALVGQTVELDGAASSDANGDGLNFSWKLIRRPAGSAAKVTTPALDRPNVIVDVAGDYILQLEVDDGALHSQLDTVTITTANTRPVADAGPDQTVLVSNIVTLDGSGSGDVDGDSLELRWSLVSKPAGSVATLSDTAAIRPEFTADLNGTYVAQLLVLDGISPSVPDTVVIATGNGRPVADAGPDQTIAAGATAQLNGAGSSDPDNDPLTYAWSILLAPGGPRPTLSDPTAANPTLDTRKEGVHVVQLVVSDGTVTSAPDTIVIINSNSRPVADAGPDRDINTGPGTLVQLDGSGSSDADSDPLTNRWALTVRPAGSTATLSSTTAVNPTFTIDVAGVYMAQLIVNDGILDSVPDAVVIDATNAPPVADAGPDQIVPAGTLVQLDGTGSSDPEGAPLTYAWTITGKPAGSVTVLSDATAASPTFTADVPGLYTVSLTVNDGQLSSAPDVMNVTATTLGANAPPFLAPIGDQVMDLGTTLILDLEASDPNGDPIAFSATPLPLPANASLDGATGEFTFQPDATQVGDTVLTFTVTDGLLTTSETVTITVNVPPGGVTAFSGRLLDANDAALGVETPIVGATISFDGLAGSTVSDSNGDFSLSPISAAGEQVLAVNSTTAAPGPGGTAYSSFHEAFELIADVNNVIARPIYLPRIDASSLTTIDPNATTTVENPNLGVTLEVGPHSAQLNGEDFTGQISVSEVPVEFAPVALPETIQPGLLLSIQSDTPGVIFATPVPISFPNVDNMPAGSEVDIYSLDAELGIFVVVGTGEVSADGTTIVTTSGGIVDASWHFFLPPAATTDASGNNNSNQDKRLCTECQLGSSTHMGTGSLSEDHTLASHRSFGRSRALRFVYNSASADPRPVITNDVTVPVRSAVPNSVSAKLTVAGVAQGTELFTSTSLPTPLSESVDETIHQAVQFDASGFDTGLYPYRLMIKNNFDASSVGSDVIDRVLVNNEAASPFGAGWALAGLQRLRMSEGRAVVTEGDGSIKAFTPLPPVPGGSFTPPTSYGTSTGGLAHALYDLDGDGDLDVVTPNGTTGRLIIFDNDGAGAFTEIAQVQAGVGGAGGNDTASVAAGDFNSDGKGDLVAANQLANTYTIHLSQPGGGYASSTLFATSRPQSVAVNDLNQDGHDDFIGVDGINPFGTGRILYGDGTGAFFADPGLTLPYPANPPKTFDTFASPVSLHTGNFNADTFPDIAMIRASFAAARAYFNTGTGDLLPHVNLSTASVAGTIGQWKLDSADFDVDGFQDIVVTSRDNNFVSIFFGQPGNSFTGRIDYPMGIPPRCVQAADLNEDGFPDIIATSSSTNQIAIRFGNGDTNRANMFAAAQFISNPVSPGCIRIGNVDGDPDDTADLVLSTNLTVHYGIPSSSPGFAPPPGDFSSIVTNPDNTFTRTLKDRTRIEFDAAGRQTAVIDRNGNTTSYGYDGAGLLTTVTGPAGLVTTLAYVGGKLSTVTDPAGRVTAFNVDANGDLISITDPDLSVRQFTYDARHLLTAQKSKRGFDTTYDYNFAGQNTQANRPDLSTRKVSASQLVGLIDTSAGLGTEGNPAPYARPADVKATFTDGNGNVTAYEMDVFGAATNVTDALVPPRVTTTTRNADGLPTQIIAPNTAVTDLVYDTKGNVLTRTEAVGDPLQRVTTFEYDPDFSLVTKITDPRTNATTINRDANGNVSQIVNAELTVTAFAYTDANCPGQVTAITAAQGLAEETVTSFTYDPVTCNLLTTTDGNLNPTTLAYDTAGNVISITDAQSRVTRFEYDGLNRLTKSIDATNIDPTPACGAAGVTCFARDGAGNMTTLTDAKGNATAFAYDTMERVETRTDPLTNAETFTYDLNGNLRFVLDRLGRTIEFRYDAANRMFEKVMEPGTGNEVLRSIGYDVADNVTSVTDPESALTFTYDLLNRRETASTAGAPFQPEVTLTSGYDANNNRTALTDPLGTADYVYNVLNRLTSLTSPGQSAITFAYDKLARLTGRNLPNGTATALAFDPGSRLTSIGHTLTTTTISNYVYGHDSVDNRTGVTQTRPAQTVPAALTYGYDDLDRLTAATNAIGGTPDESFAYDPVGNRTVSHISGSHVTDAANRLIEDDESCYSYDLNGNRTSKTLKVAGACTGDVTTYVFDAENRLVQIVFPDLTTAQYRYDGLGRRIGKTVDGAVTRYVYDGEDIALEYDGANVLKARYTHGPGIDDPLVMERDLDASGTFTAAERFTYHADGLGSITEMTDSTGTVVKSYVYDSYGQILIESGALQNPYAYTAREFDSESGLHFYRARYYDPRTGRFTSEDPIGFAGGDVNFYVYVDNNPTNSRDPSGQSPIGILGACAGGAAVGAIARPTGFLLTRAIHTVVEEIGSALTDHNRRVGLLEPDPCKKRLNSFRLVDPNHKRLPSQAKPTPTVKEIGQQARSGAIQGCVFGLLGPVGFVIIRTGVFGSTDGLFKGGFQ